MRWYKGRYLGRWRGWARSNVRLFELWQRSIFEAPGEADHLAARVFEQEAQSRGVDLYRLYSVLTGAQY